MIYPDALKIALSIYKRLEIFCYAADIVGSVRREKPEVKDLELCVCPRVVNIENLFHEVTGTQRLPSFVKEVRSLGKIVAGDPAEGRYVKIDLPEGVRLDLFIPQKPDFYRIVAIRTGSAEYSHHVLAAAWLRLGWCAVEHVGLRLQNECYREMAGSKQRWVCTTENPTLAPEFKNELELFQWLKIPWIPPSKRYV